MWYRSLPTRLRCSAPCSTVLGNPRSARSVVRFCLEKCLLRSFFLLVARRIFLIPPLFESPSACGLIVHSNRLSFQNVSHIPKVSLVPTLPRSASSLGVLPCP